MPPVLLLKFSKILPETSDMLIWKNYNNTRHLEQIML